MRAAKRIVIGCMVAAWVAFFCLMVARPEARGAEGHTHEGAAGRFYQSWMMPDAPHVSCCHEQDCAPAASRFMGDHWEARWSDNEDWVPIPADKIERDRDTPDGRSHMCGRRASGGDFMVFCFVRGGGV